MNHNLYVGLRQGFPVDLQQTAIETDQGLFYSWNDLERGSAMLANWIQSLHLPAASRIAVQTEGKGFSGRLHWQHNANQDEIALFSPLGGQVARMQKNVDGVTLTDANGNTQRAVNAESLTQNLLGWQLPLQGLADWSLGQPHSTPIQALSLDERGLITSLKQDDWLISYDQYSEKNKHLLPSKIVLRSKNLTLKILIEEWDIPKH
jgi:outer membrane lipoprotein LolB